MNVEWWGAKLASCQVQVGDIRTPCPTLGLSGFSLVARIAAWVGLSCPMDGLRRLLHGERDARAPRAPCFAKLFCYLCLSVCICG